MPSLVLAPFLVTNRVTDDAVTAEPWLINGEAPADDVLKGWDYGTDIQAHRDLEIRGDLFLVQTGLGSGSVIRIVALWSTGTGYEHGESGFTRALKIDDSAAPVRVEVDFPLVGSNLAGALSIVTLVVLEKRAGKCRDGAAWQAGSILWRDEYTLALEGIGPRMPILMVDLEPADTAWAVRTREDWLHSHPSIGVQVLVNRKRADIVRALLATPPGDKDRLVRSALRFDVGRQLIERALSDDQLDNDSVFAPQTCGAAIVQRLRAIFPQRSVEEVRAFQETEPEQFNAEVQASHRLFV